MNQYHYQSRGGRRGGGGSKAFGGVALILVAALGGFAVYTAIGYFRAQAEERQAAVEAPEDKVEMARMALTQPITSMAVLRDSSGTSLGAVQRSGTVENPQFSLSLRLPS